MAVVVLLLNNWFLIKYLSKDVAQSLDSAIESQEVVELRVAENKGMGAKPKLLAESESDLETLEASSADSLEAFMKTERFESAMQEYHRRSQERYREMEQQYKDMSADELYESYLSAESKRERLAAVQYLSQQEFADLDVEKIKDIYRDEELDRWTRSHVLRALLQTEDKESLSWAKQLVASGEVTGYEYSQLLSGVNERDPEFAKELIGGMDISRMSAMEVRRLRYLHDSELTTVFLKNNIGKILRSDRISDYVVSNNTAQLDLRRSQQERLAELMGSENKNQRSFAITQASNIQDIDLLREAYSKIERGKEKRNFVNLLNTFGRNDEQRALAREIAESSDDPMMRRFFPKN